MKCEIDGCSSIGNFAFRCQEHRQCDGCGTRKDLCYYSEGLLCKACNEIEVEKLVRTFNGDTQYTDFPVCPNCGYVEHDAWEWSDDDGEHDCGRCDATYTYSRNISVDYSTSLIQPAQDTDEVGA